jgi:ribosomal protein S1
VGDERNAKIIKMNPAARKISLSFKQAVLDLQRQDFQRYMESQDPRHTLGDIMRDQLAHLSVPRKNGKNAKDGKKKEDASD